MVGVSVKETFVCYRSELSEAEKEWKIVHENDKIKDVKQFHHPGEEKEEENLTNRLKKKPDKLNPNADIQTIDSSDELDKIKQAATLMTNRDVIGALILYTQALTTCNDNKVMYTIFVKRSDCFVQLNEFQKSLKDLQQALILNKEGTIPYFRYVRCFISLGQLEDAEDFLNVHKDVFSGCRVITKFRYDIQKIRNVQDDLYENSQSYQNCLDLINSGLDLAPASVDLLVFKIKYLVILNKFEEAKDVDNLINKRFGKVLKVLEAFSNYYECNFDKCDFEMIGKNINVRAIEDMLEKTTEFKTNFEYVKNEISAKNYSEAVSILHELYECDDTNRKAFQKVCAMLLDCYKNMKNQDDNVIKYATEILKSNPQEVDVLMARAKAFIKIKLCDMAENDLNLLLKIDGLSYDLRNKIEDFLKDIKGIKILEEQNCKKEMERTKQKKEAEEKAKIAQEKAKKDAEQNELLLKKAEVYNDKGNAQYKAMLFSNAIYYYTDAIKLCPKIGKYYTNRCTAYMSMKFYENAIRDAVKAVDVDPSFWKGYSRAINCFLILGNIKQARNYIDKMQNNIAGIDSVKFNEIPKVEKLENHHAKIVKFMDEKNYNESLKHLEAALKIATACKQYDFWLAECLIMVGKDDESQKLLTKYAKEPYAFFLKGLNAFMNNNNVNKSLEYFQEALKLDPEFTKASHYKKTVTEVRKLEIDAIRCSFSNDVRGAIAAYSSIIDFNQDNIRLKFKAFLRRAELYYNSQNFLKAFEDCSMALRLKFNEKDSIFIDALILRAKIHCKQKEFEYAMIDCDEILRIVGSVSKYKDEVDVLRKEAKHSSLHRDVRNYYEILRIPRNSSMVIIKEAFKNLSLLYHSDKHPGATAVEKKKLELRFQEIRTAFECLKVQHEC